MGLTLVTGGANSGKTGVVYGIVRDAAAHGLSPVVVVPTAPDARRARLEFSRDAVFGVRVAPASTFLGDLWGLWGDGRRLVTPAQRLAAVTGSLRDATLVALSESAKSPGFPRFLERLAAEAASYDEGTLTGAGDVESETLDLLGAYRTVLAGAGLVEPAEAWRILAGQTPQLPGPVVVHRFLDLDPGIERFVVGCSTINDVVVSLTWRRARGVTAALEPLVGRLSAVAQRHLEVSDVAGGTVAELARIEADLMEEPCVMAGEGAVAFGEAGGAEAEAIVVAREARQLADRFTPGAVAVVFRDMAGRLPAITQALESQNLPFDVDVVEAVCSTPLGSSLADLLVGMTGPGDPRALTAFLVTPYAGVDRDVREQLDAAWRGRRPASARELAQGVAVVAPDTGHLLVRALLLTEGGIDAVSLAEWKRLLDSLLCRRFGSIPEAGDTAFARDASAHRAAFEAVSAMVEARDEAVSARDVLAALREARTAARTYERVGHVQLVEAHRVGARRFEGIVMGGLDDAGFSPSSRGDAMGELLAHLAPIPPGDRALKERLIFYNAVTRARSRLVLVRKSSDSDGRIVRPSPFWDEMLDFYRDPALGPGVPEQVAADSVMAADASAASPAFGRGRADLRRAIAEGADAPSIPAPAERGRLTDEAILTELAARDLFSATELEKYVRCPYRWFYERTVRPEPLDGERGPMESGRLIHEVLREFYAGALREATGSGRVTHGNLDHALEVVDAVLDAEIARSDARVPVSLAEEDEVATARARCRGLVMADADFLPGTEPWKVEWAFGGDDHPVAITDFGIHGRVDRVDRGSGTVAVMDYKRGKVPTGAEIKDGRSLQVMLYAYAVRRVLGERVTHGFYRGLAASTDLAVAPEDTFIAKDSDGGSVEMTYLDAALDAAVAAVAGIRAGRIPADPKSGACSFCGAAATCPRRPQ